MIEKFEIKIIRFKTGEDIIGFVHETKDSVEIKYPKTFYFSIDTTEEFDPEMIIMDWMTSYAFAFQAATLPRTEILFITYPNIDFGYNYLTCISEELDPESKFYTQVQILLAEQNKETPHEASIPISSEVFPKIIH